MLPICEEPLHCEPSSKDYSSLVQQNLAHLRQKAQALDNRDELKSRDTLFHFYCKDKDHLRKKTPGYFGLESRAFYYGKYKNLGKELEEQSQGYSPTTAYLSKVKSYQVLPSPLGLMNVKPPKQDKRMLKAT